MAIIKHPHSPEFVVKQIDEQIAQYEHLIGLLKEKRVFFEKADPILLFETAPKLTKEFIRDFMRFQVNPVQTVQVIEILFPQEPQEVKDKYVKTLSVIFNTLFQDGQVKIEKKKGVKGNFYTWIK